MGEKFWFENDGYGIVGWSFKCDHCNKINSFAGCPDSVKECEKCGSLVLFTDEETQSIENGL